MLLAVILLRSRPGDDFHDFVIFVLSALVIGYFITRYLNGLRERARKRDHVVETGAHVAIPDHCVRCGRAHPQLRLEAARYNLGSSPLFSASRPK